MSEENDDHVVIHDRADRRRFIRVGAAFVAAAGTLAVSSSRQALAADCDRGGSGGEKSEQAGNGSDSDAGANADPMGCGRNYKEKPKISQVGPHDGLDKPKAVQVARIIG